MNTTTTERYNPITPVHVPIAPPIAPPVRSPAEASAKAGLAAPSLKKVSFGRMAKKTDTRTAYPVFPDDNKEAAAIAARIIERTAAFDTLEGQLKTDKAELKMMVAPHYFAVNRGKGEIPSSVAVNSAEGEVLVCFQNRYSSLPDEQPLTAVLPPEFIGTYFMQSFSIKIKGEKLPQDPDTCQQLLGELQDLFARYHSAEALEATEGVAPKKNFHDDRHRVLTIEQNLALEQVCPVIAMIKTKGRR